MLEMGGGGDNKGEEKAEHLWCEVEGENSGIAEI